MRIHKDGISAAPLWLFIVDDLLDIHVDGQLDITSGDWNREEIPAVDYPRVDPVPGCNVQLTIDMNIQQIVDEELAAGVERAKGAAGTAVFMNLTLVRY